MHRSGTSLTTSWLETWGLIIHEGSYLGPNDGNIEGHFEDKAFVRLHEKIIKSEIPASKGWIVCSQKELSFSGEDYTYINETVEKRNQKYSFWGWKDPRTVFFLNYWKSIIPSLKVLIADKIR